MACRRQELRLCLSRPLGGFLCSFPAFGNLLLGAHIDECDNDPVDGLALAAIGFDAADIPAAVRSSYLPVDCIAVLEGRHRIDLKRNVPIKAAEVREGAADIGRYNLEY
ncbi:hypothetical protein D3C87_1172170 [compost metagenome]